MEAPFKRCPHNVEKGSEHEQVSVHEEEALLG